MSISEKIIVSLTENVFRKLYQKFDKSIYLPKLQAKKHLEIQFRQLLQWSSKIELFELSQGLNLLDFTLDLTLTNSPKKLAKFKKKSIVNADSLAYLNNHILVLGDPGSGKTTTLKRVVKKMFEDISSNGKYIKTPILFKLRETRLNEPLVVMLAKYLGVKYHKDEKNREYYIGDKPMEFAIIDLLDSINSYILFDGLDEIDTQQQIKLMNEISEISFKLNSSKILITSRTGNYNSLLEGFSVFELEPLTPNQIEQIILKWLNGSHESFLFLKELKSKPYSDTIDRPLSLINILIIYLNKNYLPDQPSAIYEILIDLYIEKWDDRRRITRKSKYAEFLPKQKLKFLAELSFHLLYKMGKSHITFSHKDLLIAYEAIHEKYRLPKDQARIVIKEIQSHNGIIIENFDNNYQFSHLTYQEYLAAWYITRNPLIHDTHSYLCKRPSPVAVAITISGTPNNWFNALFLGERATRLLVPENEAQINEFLKRILVEKPYFSMDIITGFAFINIAFCYCENERIISILTSLIKDPMIKKTMKRSLVDYYVLNSSNNPKLNELTLKGFVKISNFYTVPKTGKLPIFFTNEILKVD